MGFRLQESVQGSSAAAPQNEAVSDIESLLHVNTLLTFNKIQYGVVETFSTVRSDTTSLSDCF